MTIDPAISAVAALDDELRRGMYVHIRRARRPVTRDEAAAAVGISRKLAAFHLDKLVDAGLLRARYEAVGGVRKAGRTPKVYEPADTDFRVTIPERRHELLADILMDAVLSEGEGGRAGEGGNTGRAEGAGGNAGRGENAGENARQAAVRVAGRRGVELGAAERAQARPGRLGAERALTLTEGVLARHGFEPIRVSPTCVRLGNCPFHPLAARAPELVCGINLAFLDGLLAGLLDVPRVGGPDGVPDAPARAVLAPRPGECCVELRSSRES
ncbi:helix-turn-helix domain-containing protein [Microbispora sp. RL4-1S]|uniref:Helix-turn-helix domain-containing protein n=1 Tax=Microbispora oryzae TaxID=2806554 RepID=A0A941AR40_9ACTN|nr:helix-turn-helix domain-containing protein [Microbispora oryzae]MBP2705494.1 helix-turn-helix domain-containing protein [Microbispora oryzae]